MTIPSVGQMVEYTLNTNDADCVNRRRSDAKARQASYPATGYVVHTGNDVTAGNWYPMVITRVWSEAGVNGQVFLDGNDTIWVTSVQQGDGEHHWREFGARESRAQDANQPVHTDMPGEPSVLAVAPRLAVDADGYVWRVFSDGMWSMAPVNPDNSPIPQPVTYYVPRLDGPPSIAYEEFRAVTEDRDALRAQLAEYDHAADVEAFSLVGQVLPDGASELIDRLLTNLGMHERRCGAGFGYDAVCVLRSGHEGEHIDIMQTAILLDRMRTQIGQLQSLWRATGSEVTRYREAELRLLDAIQNPRCQLRPDCELGPHAASDHPCGRRVVSDTP